ncbi:uncharacterized protein LOC111558755 [Felis catus]|uniref:uncharacterized protein LOC111558755 n=1 Tax=Felis catus TaxID=9685 RepID=UPI001D19EAC9|nr:uncharacterized protein LOC111558755 [Felis catus]XP_044906974.1 uncharacterized protein LOC111558755 [Felis catus]
MGAGPRKGDRGKGPHLQARLCHPGATASGSTLAGLAWIQRSYQALSAVGSLPIRTARTPLQGPSATESCLLPCSGQVAGHIPPLPAKNDWDQTQAPRAQVVPSMEAAAWPGSSSSSLQGEEQSSARCPLTPERHLTRPAGCPALVWVQGANRAQPGPCGVERGRGGHSGEAARLCSQSRDGRGQTPEEHGRRMRCSNSRGTFRSGRGDTQPERRVGRSETFRSSAGGRGSTAGEQLPAGSGYPQSPRPFWLPSLLPHSALKLPGTSQEATCFCLLPFRSMGAGGAARPPSSSPLTSLCPSSRWVWASGSLPVKGLYHL